MIDDLLRVLEAAYQLELSDPDWLAGVVTAIHRGLSRGKIARVRGEQGVVGFQYEIQRDGRISVSRTASTDIPDRFVSLLTRVPPELPPAYVRDTFGRYLCSLASRAGGKKQQALTQRHMTVYGETNWRDVLVLNGRDPTNRGIWIGVPLERDPDLRDHFFASWTKVAVHLAAALRLRGRLAGVRALQSAEAVVEPDGAIAHARGRARTRAARAALAGSVRALEQLRAADSKRRRARPLASWKGLVEARWTLVDHFESNGRRLLLAQCNDAPTHDVSRLTERERQVVAFASLGHPNKLIAYELGISPSTVGVFLNHAARRLGARTRAELIEKVRPSSNTAGQVA